jgi:hypothetical protein
MFMFMLIIFLLFDLFKNKWDAGCAAKVKKKVNNF